MRSSLARAVHQEQAHKLLMIVISILKDNHDGDTVSLRALLHRWTSEQSRPSIPASMFMFALA